MLTPLPHLPPYYSTQATRKALERFRDEDATRVFLLSHRAGAQGLTLVRANHVFLLEPSLDAAIEQQAIARVHRIGQDLPVKVVRFLVEKTIEEEVLEIQRGRQAVLFREDGPSQGGGGGGADAEEDDGEGATTVATKIAQEEMDEAETARLLRAVLG